MLLNIFFLTLLHHVASYDSEIFPEILKKQNAILRISSRNCELCESNRKKWDTLVVKYKNNEIYTENIFCEDNKTICENLNITSYPTIAFNFGKEWLFLKHDAQKNMETLFSHQPAICRFPNNISGCHEDTIKWTEKTKEHSMFDYEKEMQANTRKFKPLLKQLHKYGENKKIINEKKMYLEHL